MKRLLTLLFLFGITTAFGQSNEDSKIIITINDNVDIYEKVKHALVNADFMVKDNGNKDTLTTYSREYSSIYCIARAVIEGNTVILTGAYGLRRIDDWGYTRTPKNYKRIIYYKGSKSWKLLMQVANKINGQITYSK